MPSTNIFNEYQQWLASAPTVGTLIICAEFYWLSPATNQIFLGNHITVPTVCIYETGAQITLTPYQFNCTRPERSGSTESNISLTGPLTGPLFTAFQNLRGRNSDFNVRLEIRYFLYPNGMGRPLSNKPERYYVTSVTYSRTAVNLEATMSRLPRLRAGIPYSVEEYPGLGFNGN